MASRSVWKGMIQFSMVSVPVRAYTVGGPDATTSFNLANVLHGQVVEIDPNHADAWNNLGLMLSQRGHRDEACHAFRQALHAEPIHTRAIYNMADTLDEMGRREESLNYWKAYLRLDSSSEWGRYARQRLA
jgi:tetratricopeptide (TPR) repeat protein